MMKKSIFTQKENIVLFVLLFLLPLAGKAQCAMCRAVLESGGNTEVAEGINNGIVYLMAIPYILIGALLFIIFRKVRS
jgi:hypothetical protein